MKFEKPNLVGSFIKGLTLPEGEPAEDNSLSIVSGAMVSRSNGVRAAVPLKNYKGQARFSTPGARQWTVPDSVRELCVVTVGAGYTGPNSNNRRGSGGDLRYRNFIPVTPGETLEIIVGDTGAPGGNSIVRRLNGAILLEAKGGSNVYSTPEDTLPYEVFGGDGGVGYGRYGGGAGGYSGDGSGGELREPATGGAGGAGAWYFNGHTGGGAGGGVGLYGEGESGVNGTAVNYINTGAYSTICGGKGGSGGQDGTHDEGGNFGGGSGDIGEGGNGGIRIVWGRGRYFPSTNVQDAQP